MASRRRGAAAAGTRGRTPRRSRAGRGAARATGFRWARSSDATLLELRLRDLGVRLQGSWVADCVEDLYRNLEARGLNFRPHVWLSSDWFSPEGVPGIAVPFYLVHPRLQRLERRQMLEVEGGTREECLKILRHEAGHAIVHAFRLGRRRSWQRMFGRSSRRYPEVYRPNPASRRFVQHLRLYYAQSHPDEDFAETFAVWLQPRSAWRRRYAGWPALAKLEYVDALMAELAGRKPPVRNRSRLDPVERLGQTLRDYYARKRAHYAPRHPDAYDRDLRRLFSDNPRHRRAELASTFLRRHRAEIRRLVARWTGEYEFTLEQVLGDIIARCRQLRLRAVGGKRRLVTDFALLLTVKTMRFHYGTRQWIAL